MADRLWHLKNCDLFKRLTPEQISRLEARCRFRHFPRKSLVYLPSDYGDSVLLLTFGRVKMYHLTPQGKQTLLAIIEPGELFGELALIEPGRREEFAETMEPSGVILIPGEEVQRLIREHPVVSLEVTRLMGLRRQHIERRLRSLLYHSPRERFAHLLLELAQKYGQPSPEGVAITIRLSHQDMASAIGTTREMVTVILGEMRLGGQVIVRRRRVILRDLSALAASIDEPTPPIPTAPQSVPRSLSQARTNL